MFVSTVQCTLVPFVHTNFVPSVRRHPAENIRFSSDQKRDKWTLLYQLLFPAAPSPIDCFVRDSKARTVSILLFFRPGKALDLRPVELLTANSRIFARPYRISTNSLGVYTTRVPPQRIVIGFRKTQVLAFCCRTRYQQDATFSSERP